jgi:hypothetical protein
VLHYEDRPHPPHRVPLPRRQENGALVKLDAVKWEMLEEWSKTKRAPRHAAFLHEKEFAR